MRSQAQIKQTLIDLLPPGAEDLYALGARWSKELKRIDIVARA